MSIRTDTTPLETRVILLAVLAVTIATLGMLQFGWIDPGKSTDIASILWLFTGLFVLRVVGQILIVVRPQRWLPPMGQWNLIPYPILLPIQLVFITVMLWIDISFTLNIGITNVNNQVIGDLLIAFSAVYVMAMAIRYAIRMSRHPDQRWFGGTIPIVFHVVLASYLFTLGSFYVIA